MNKLNRSWTEDELSEVLNDPQVPSPEDWWATRDDWVYNAELTPAVEADMVEIQDSYSRDLNVFFSVDDVKDLFDFDQTYYEQLCSISMSYIINYSTADTNGL